MLQCLGFDLVSELISSQLTFLYAWSLLLYTIIYMANDSLRVCYAQLTVIAGGVTRYNFIN